MDFSGPDKRLCSSSKMSLTSYWNLKIKSKVENFVYFRSCYFDDFKNPLPKGTVTNL